MPLEKKKILSYKDRLDFGPFKGQKVMSVAMHEPKYILAVQRTHPILGFKKSIIQECESLIEKRKFN